MVRAIFFDFYGVWTPDVFADYLNQAEQLGTEKYVEVYNLFNQYFFGTADLQTVINNLQIILNNPEIGVQGFIHSENDISPAIADFMRTIHSHFIKLGVLANLGQSEYALLNRYNEQLQLFEVITCPLAIQPPTPLLTDDVFGIALQGIGEPPESCLVVTGNEKYSEYAQSIGMQVLPFQGFPHLQQSLADIIANDMPTPAV